MKTNRKTTAKPDPKKPKVAKPKIRKNIDAVHESEGDYRALLDAARDVIVTLAPDGTITSLNPAFETFTGWSRDEWLGRTFDGLLAEEDSPRALELFNRILQGESLRAFRLRMHTRSGEEMVVELNMSPQFRDGQVVGTLGIARNMTEEQRAEDILKASEERFRALIENSSDAIALISADGTILYESPSVTRMMGYSLDKLIGRNVFEMVHPDDQPQVLSVFSRVLQRPNESDTATVRYRHKNGTWLWIEGTGKNLLDEPGIQAIVVNYRDITLRKQAEEVLRASEEQFRTLFENAPVGIGVADLQGNLLAFNDAMLVPGKYTRADIEKLGNVAALYHDPQGRKEALALFQRQGYLRAHEVRFRRRDGSPYDALLSLTHTIFNGQPAVQAMVEDITERKRAEEEIRRSAETMTALYETTRDLVIERDLPKLLQTIVERAARLLNAEGGGLYLCEPENGQVRCVVSYNTLRDYTGTVLKYGEGAAGLVAQTGEPLMIDDYSEWEGRAQTYEEGKPFRAVMSVPMKWQDETIGVIHVLVNDREHHFTEDDLNLIKSFANQASITVQNARLYMDIHQRNRTLSALQEATLPLMGQLELSEVLHTILAQASQLLRTQHGYIYLVEPDNDAISVILGEGVFSEYKGRKLKPGEGLAGKVWQTGEPLNVRDYHTWKGRSSQYEGTTFHAVVGVPLTSGIRVVGVLGLAHLELNRIFSDDDMELLSRFAQLASIAFENARLYALSQREIVERKIAENALIESRAQLSGIIESAMDAIITVDSDQNVIIFNTAAEKMFGCPADEAIGQPIDRFIPDRYRTSHHKHIHRFGQSGITSRSTTAQTNLWGLRNDGSEFPVEISISQTHAGGQKIYTAIVRDITERKQAEENLRAAESRYRTLVEQIPAIVYTAEPEQYIGETYISPQIEQLGFTQKEWVADPDRWLKQVHPEDRERVLAEIEDVREERKPFRSEYRLITRDGQTRWFYDEVIHVMDDKGKPLLLQGIMLDITERKEAEERIKRQLDRLKALRTIDMAITASTDLHLSLQIIMKQVISQLKVDAVDILLLNSTTHTLEYGDGMGFYTRGIEQTNQRADEGYAGRAVRERNLVSIDNLENYPHNFPLGHLITGEKFVAYWGTPLIVKGEVKGVLEAFRRSHYKPDQEWLDFLESLAGQTALAIDNATLFESLRRSNLELGRAYETTLEGWSAALDLRDKETEGHTLRVMDLTLRLAEEMRLNEKEQAQIRRGVLLHDIGKMGVPDRILFKSDDLTDEEWAIMRRHPVYAYELLSRIEYLRPALNIPYCHHERWDGSGYPRGLKGEEIPLEARLFAVVDVYDALTSDRPYRPAWTKEKTLEHIYSLSGTHFDPKVVDAFLALPEMG